MYRVGGMCPERLGKRSARGPQRATVYAELNGNRWYVLDSGKLIIVLFSAISVKEIDSLQIAAYNSKGMVYVPYITELQKGGFR